MQTKVSEKKNGIFSNKADPTAILIVMPLVNNVKIEFPYFLLK